MRFRDIRFAVAALAMIVASESCVAQTTGADDCLVSQAADAAQQRQLAMLDAAKINPQDFFSGPQSCISSALLQNFDLSNFIPDLAGMLTGGIGNMISSVINQAQQQVCSILNSQIRDVVQQMNSVSGQFDSSLSGQLRGVLGSGSSMRMPSYPGYGQYNFNQPPSYGSVFGASSGSSPAPVSAPPANYTYTPSSSNTFGAQLFGQ